jgi:uncharacterized protein (TIGR00251 family)
MTQLKIQEADGGVVFSVKVIPASSRTTVSGLMDGMIKVKVSAAPEKGKANQCLIGFLAKQLGVKKSSIKIITGQTSPVKKVQVLGLSAETVAGKLTQVV